MKIEDYWEDKTLYYVEFFVIMAGIEKKICKTIVAPFDMDEEEMFFHVETKFNQVRKVIRIEEIEECLSLKIE